MNKESMYLSYKQAALEIGVTHHYVRMLTSKGVLEIAKRIEIRPNVLKVYLTRSSVEAYKEKQRVRYTHKYRLTQDEKAAVDRLLEEVRNGSDR